jgi:hypothetical protein
MLDAASAEEYQRRMFGQIDAEELKRYATKRSSFLEEYASYLRETREFEIARARRFSLDLELVNSGSMPAADVDVRLHVLDGVIVADAYDLSEPEAPEPPGRPRTPTEILIAGMQTPELRTLGSMLGRDAFFHDILPLRGRGPRDASSLDIEETGSFTVKWHADRVKHGLKVSLPTIFVTIPEDAPIRPFQVTYALHAANLPEAVNGTLNVVVRSGPAEG